MQSGVLGAAGADSTGSGAEVARGDADVFAGVGAASVRGPTLVASLHAAAGAEAPLPLVDAPPRARVSRRLFGGIVLLGDVVVLAAVTLMGVVALAPLLVALAGGVAFLLMAWVGGHYGPRDSVASLVSVLSLGAAATMAAAVLQVAMGTDAASWNGFAVWASAGGAGLLAWRLWLGHCAAVLRLRGELATNLAILGDCGVDALQAAVSRDGTAAGVAIFGRHAADASAAPPGRARWPGLWADVAAGHVDGVVIALPWTQGPAMARACQAVRGLAVDVWLVPPPDDPAALLAGEEVLPGVVLLAAERRPLGDWRGVVKRIEDVVLGILLLFLFAAPMVLVALVVAVDSRGPVLLRQRRFGYGNAAFDVFKFRTMYHNLGDASGARATLPGDRRVTRVGRFLRASSLDELPQLFNVLKGDMSLVGPRPHPIDMNIQNRLYHLVAPDYAARHRMKPGITGLAQISGYRGLVDTPEKAHGRLAYDLQYIRNWSVRGDLLILWRTLFKGFFGSGAF